MIDPFITAIYSSGAVPIHLDTPSHYLSSLTPLPDCPTQGPCEEELQPRSLGASEPVGLFSCRFERLEGQPWPRVPELLKDASTQ
jgi:hypothetical protein